VFLKKCCLDGYVQQCPQYPQLEPLDDVILDAIKSNHNNFSRNSSTYNNILSFGATGVENDKGGGWCRVKGHHSAKINGRTYHTVHKAESADPSGGISYFTFDLPTDVQNHAAGLNSNVKSTKDRVDEGLLVNIFRRMKVINPIAKELAQFGAAAESLDFSDNKKTPELYARLNYNVKYLEVAQITNAIERFNRVVTVRLRGGGGSTIPVTSSVLETICYPLLFNRGELGWGEETRKIVSFTDYMASRLLKPDVLSDGTVLQLPSKADPNILLPTNRFQAMARLGSVYIVDMCSRGKFVVWMNEVMLLISKSIFVMSHLSCRLSFAVASTQPRDDFWWH
jgi:hypothetical protein